MTQQVISDRFSGSWKGSTLPAILAGDLSAAALSATLIAPVLTAIDRAVVENAASSNRPLFSTLKTHILCSFRYPRLFFNAKPFFIIWTLYAATYSTANSAESLAKAFTQRADQVLVGSITFLSTCIVNVPLGVWKDVRFVQIYGRNTSSSNVINTPTTKAPPTNATQRPSIQPAKFPRIVGATFLFRDAITILGSFTLPSMLSSTIPESVLADPMGRTAATQLFVPVLSQVVATPVHLLGLDLYNHAHQYDSSERISRIRRNLGPTTMLRCCRIIPAFGVGCIVNTNLRDYFHEKAGSASM